MFLHRATSSNTMIAVKQSPCPSLLLVVRGGERTMAKEKNGKGTKIAQRLKILWDERAAVLPGCLTAVYDLPRGIATQLWFDQDAAPSEFKRGMVAVGTFKAGTLVLGDRLGA